MTPGLSEILDKVQNTPSAKKVEVIQKYAHSTVLIDYIRLLFEKPEWDLPGGMLEFRPSIYYDNHSIIHSEWRKIRQYFIKDSSPHLSIETKTRMWIQMLEILNEKDAKLLEYLRHGNTPYKWLTRKFVDKAFPGLLPPLA